MKCLNCHKIFYPRKYLGYSKFCTKKCENDYNTRFPTGDPNAPKTLDEWVQEAKDCGLDYGNYRAQISLGKTFEELKARVN